MTVGLKIQNLSKLVAGLGLVAIAVVFTACGGSNNNSTPQQVANVPANQCIQPGTTAFNGYPGVNPYNYTGQATGCLPGQVPTCYANNGGLACLPQSSFQGLYNQGYNPMFYGYNSGLNTYGYQGFFPYTQSYFTFSYGFGGVRGGYGGGGGYGGYYPNRYVQGCQVGSFMNSCGWGGICRPVGYGRLGICVR